jgi:haloalkane dehalogenase
MHVTNSADPDPLNRNTLPAWLDTDAYPFVPKRFATAEGELSYLDEGHGPVVLFVHGTPSWSFEWRHVIGALVSTHRCIAPDHLGFGLSDKHERSALTPADHARRLRELVRALDVRSLSLVVHDFGGPIGLPLALDEPERVARIVVVNSFLWPNGDDPQVAKLARVLGSPLGAFLYRWLNFSPRVLLPASFGERAHLSKAVHRQYLEPFARRREREAPYALARALVGADDYYRALWARRAELSSKLEAIVWGERDPAFRERHLARWREAFPNAHIERSAHAGHFVAEEDPDAVVRAIRGV